jgi:hypothetical protein
MKLSSNILVHRFGVEPPAAISKARSLKSTRVLKSVNAKIIGGALTKSARTSTSGASRKKAAKKAAWAAAASAPLPPQINVGVWNLDDYWLGYLPAWLETLNKSQNRYRFYMIEATAPLGMVRKPEGVVAWAQDILHRPLARKEAKGMESHTIAEEYYAIAETLRKEIRVSTAAGAAELDYLVGITPGMVAGVEGKGVYWNHFSTASGRLVLTSLFDLCRYAKETNKPLAAFVLGVIFAQLLSAQFYQHTGLGFHDENRGCMFDYHGDRESLKESIIKMEIEPACFALIPADFQPAVKNILKVIKKLR